MANLFLASEILEINIIEERNGAAYYISLSESTKNKELAKAAAEIAEQEKTHEKRFTKMLDQVRAREPEESYAGEFNSYIQALMNEKMFPDEEAARIAAMNKSDEDAIYIALKTEEATLKILNSLKENVDSSEMKYVDLTVKEEQDHVARLNQILKNLQQ